MAETAAPKSAPVKVIAGGALFNSRQQIESSHTAELVIALCGPIGSPIHKVAEAIKHRLESEFGYERCEIIRLSKIIEEKKGSAPASPPLQRIEDLIRKGDELRKDHGASVLAELAVSQIAIDRQKTKAAAGAERPLPRRVCHIIDSIKNQQELEILRLVYRDMLYFVGVYSPLPSRVKTLEKEGMAQSEIYRLIDKDSGEELDHGQTVRDTFPEADFFLRVDADTDSQIQSRVQRFLDLILGVRVMTPTAAETAMYQAASAAGNSACLSRQVGAAVTDRHGEVLAIGWNDVPKAGGSLYTSDPKADPNGEKDKRCWNRSGGLCFNDQEKRVMAELLVEALEQEKLIDPLKRSLAVNAVAKNSKVKHLIEFSRAVHAEMHAILTASQASGDRAKGGKLFCTTYPCHSCARHIVAAGITEVYYIEPYRKSLATKLHDDSITEDEADTGKVRILPYDGVAPARYLKLFRVPRDTRKKEGRLVRVDAKKSSPRFDKTVEALSTLEALVVKELQEKKLLTANENA